MRAPSPADALSAFLSSRAYYDRAGGNREGFIRRLLGDVGHQEQRGLNLERWLARTQGRSRQDIAHEFLSRYPANWWPGPEATPPAELGGEGGNDEEDLYDEPPPPPYRDPYRNPYRDPYRDPYRRP